MSTLVQWLGNLPMPVQWLAELLVASTVCLTLGWIADLVSRRRSAAYRAALWLIAFLSIVPWMTARLAGAAIEVPLLPPQTSAVVASEPAMATDRPVLPRPARALFPSVQDSGARRQLPSGAPVASIPHRSFDPGLAVAAVWFVGVGVGLLRVLAGAWALRRCLRFAQAPVPESPLAMIVAEVTAAHPRHLHVLLHPEVGSPLSFGVRAWWILLPAESAHWSPERIRLVLAHEVAHGERRDHLALLFLRTVLAFCWLQPLAWLGLRRFRMLCERAADDRAIAQRDPESYAQELLQLVREARAGAKVWPSAALSIGGRSSLGERVAALLDRSTARRQLSTRAFVLLLAASMALAIVLPSLRVVAAEKAAPPVPERSVKVARAKQLLVFVQDEDGNPLAGARISPFGLRAELNHTTSYGWTSEIPNSPRFTDALGHASIEYPSLVDEDLATSTVTAHVTHSDFCGQYVEIELQRPEPIVLKRGARVRVSALPPPGKATGWKMFAQVMAAGGFSYSAELINWRPEEGGTAMIGQVRPDWHLVRAVGFDSGGGRYFSDPVIIEARADARENLELAVQRGGRVAGRLADNVPRPVRNGRVTVAITTVAKGPESVRLQEAQKARNAAPNRELSWQTWARVELDGSFVLTELPPGEMAIFALCDGYVSTDPTGPQQSVTTNPQIFEPAPARDLVVLMEKAGVAKLKVLGPDGAPLANARVSFGPNQMAHSLSNIFGTGIDEGALLLQPPPAPGRLGEAAGDIPSWSAISDEAGLATVANLPQGTYPFGVTANRFELPLAMIWGRPAREAVIVIKPGETASATVKLETEGTSSLRQAVEAENTKAGLVHVTATPEAAPLPEIPTAQLTGSPFPVQAGQVLGGQVVDEAGVPLAGVLVDAWTRRPGRETKSDGHGSFELKFPAWYKRAIEVQFSLAGFSPIHVTRQPLGTLREKVTLRKTPRFEGTVTDSKGRPVPGVRIRAACGEKEAEEESVSVVWCEAQADEQGRYRLQVFPDTFRIEVRSEAGEVACLLDRKIAEGEIRPLEIALKPGYTLSARVIDAITQKPVRGFRLHDDERSGVEGVSDERGDLVIKGLFPGNHIFEVDAEKIGYSRWWSEATRDQWESKRIDSSVWQDNFNPLEFSITHPAESIRIEVEQGVRFRGRVRDPAGKPIAGATVISGQSGVASSLTGDSRFDVTSREDGSFEMLLPASHGTAYNLAAHDGEYGTSRGLANGVLPPIKTQPGQIVEGLEISLCVPCVISGKVVDLKGQPVAGREVRAVSPELNESFYHPTTRTKADGTFVLRAIRAGRQVVQPAPFHDHKEALLGPCVEVDASPKAPVVDVVLTVH